MNVVMCTSALIHVFNIVLTFLKNPAGALVLHCNRRGIVGLASGSDKASLSVEELLENRRRGMSYARNRSIKR